MFVWGWIADPIWAGGLVPRQQAEHMTAIDPPVRILDQPLHPRGRPHMTLTMTRRVNTGELRF
jgi:hypothetical protein